VTPEQGRELFNAALDDELEPSARAELDALLAAHPDLAAEYAALHHTLTLVRAGVGQSPTPDLLPRVQRRLRIQSRGRYYGDRFAERSRRGAPQPLVLAGVLLAVLGLLWLALRVLDYARF